MTDQRPQRNAMHGCLPALIVSLAFWSLVFTAAAWLVGGDA